MSPLYSPFCSSLRPSAMESEQTKLQNDVCYFVSVIYKAQICEPRTTEPLFYVH